MKDKWKFELSGILVDLFINLIVGMKGIVRKIKALDEITT